MITRSSLRKMKYQIRWIFDTASNLMWEFFFFIFFGGAKLSPNQEMNFTGISIIVAAILCLPFFLFFPVYVRISKAIVDIIGPIFFILLIVLGACFVGAVLRWITIGIWSLLNRIYNYLPEGDTRKAKPKRREFVMLEADEELSAYIDPDEDEKDAALQQ